MLRPWFKTRVDKLQASQTMLRLDETSLKLHFINLFSDTEAFWSLSFPFVFVRNLFATAPSLQVQPVPAPEDVAIVKKSLHLKTALPCHGHGMDKTWSGLWHSSMSWDTYNHHPQAVYGAVCIWVRCASDGDALGKTLYFSTKRIPLIHFEALHPLKDTTKYASMKAKRRRGRDSEIADWQEANWVIALFISRCL